MVKSEAIIGIYLHQLIAREEAVIKRVIAFGSAQGRNYQRVALPEAQIVVVSDDTSVDSARLNPEGCRIARIAAADTDQPYDVLMERPLLVTRVMRSLDNAVALLQVDPTTATVDDAESSTEAESKLPEKMSEPEPESVCIQAEPATDADKTIESECESDPVISTPEATIPETGAEFQYKALIVDDSAAIRKQLELELRNAGIRADFAEDGEQAMEKVAANRYDLIFLDIVMPGMDGYEACRQMRLRAELKKTPIIMLSAKTSPLDEVQGVIAGASTYLTKPVRSEQLQTTLKRVSMWIDHFQA